MTEKEINELFNIDKITFRKWKKSNKSKLCILLERLEFKEAKRIIGMYGDEDLKRILENELYFEDGRTFERELYPLLISNSGNENWLRLSKDTSLSNSARMRSAYIYSFLTRKHVELNFEINDKNVSFFHKTRPDTKDQLAAMYGLKNGIDMMRFNQFKSTGYF